MAMGTSLLRRRALMMANVSPLPAEYAPLKYIQSSGHQWLDTGVNVHFDNEIVEVVIDFQNLTTSNWKLVITNTRSSDYDYSISPLLNKIRLHIGYQSTEINLDNLLDRKLIKTVSSVSDASRKCTTDCYENGTYVGNTYGMLSPNYHLYPLGGGTNRTTDSIAKLFAFSIKSDSVNMDWLPALRKSDNKPGMYDLITNTFFVNQGTGEFGYEKVDGTIIAPI